MAKRKVILANNQYYHIYNRTIDRRKAFTKRLVCKRIITALNYYRFANTPYKLSNLLILSRDRRKEVFDSLKKTGEQQVEILSYCLMPNHYHILLKQISTSGISTYIGNTQNSITRYFNTKEERRGHLFEGQFKAVRIETEEQLIHVSRYIHLNPLTAYVVEEFNGLLNYKWSSLFEYINNSSAFCSKGIVMSYFKSGKEYLTFIRDNIDYQRTLHEIKHLAIEKGEL